MSICDNILNNPNQLLITISALIDDEKNRIWDNKLVGDELSSLIKPITRAIYKNAKQHRDWGIIINNLSGLHNLLKSIKLPGDFEKIAEEGFYIALDLPYEGFDISKEEKECSEREEKEKEEKECETCSCMECEDDMVAQEVLAESVNVLLEKIANSLGDEGDHEAAYLVERTIRSINRKVENGKLLDK